MRGFCPEPQVFLRHSEGDQCGDRSRGKIYGVVTHKAPTFQGRTQKTVGNHAEYAGGGADWGGAPSGDAGQADPDCRCETSGGSGESNRAIGAGCRGLPIRHQAGNAADRLANFAGDGVGGGLGQGCAYRDQEPRISPESRINQRTDCGDAEICEDLGRVSSGAWLCGSQSLLAGIAEAGCRPGKKKDHEQSSKPAPSGSGQKRKADQGSGYGTAASHSANCPAKTCENDGNEGRNPEFAEC